MKKVLILGAQGMLGNAIYRYLNNKAGITVFGTARKKTGQFISLIIGRNYRSTLVKTLKCYKPDYVINCIALIKPLKTDFNKALMVNSIFPHILAQLCTDFNTRLIHFSTNGVFSGKKGNYKDADTPDATDIYGITKFLGEVRQPPHVTIRTSLIGYELSDKNNLLNWFLDSKKTICGYSRVYWNGITTLTMAKIIHRIIVENLQFESSLIQITGDKMTKYQLLNIFKKVYNIDTTIMKNRLMQLNQTLTASAAQKQFADLIAPIENQINQLKQFYVENH